MIRRRVRGGIGGVYQRRDTAIWWMQYSVNGEQRRESTGQTDRQAAQDVLKARLAEIQERGAAPRIAGKLTVADLQAYLERAYRNRWDPTPDRMQQYQARARQYVANLSAYFGDTPVRAITTNDIEAYVDHRRVQPRASSSTIRSEVSALGRGLRLALKRSPMLPTLGVRNTRKGFLTRAQLVALLPHLADDMRAVTEAAYITGWRRGELLGLTWARVDWDRGVIRIDSSKNDEGREFPLSAHPRLAALLHDQREWTSALERATGAVCPLVFHRDGGPFGWPFYPEWRAACKAAGIPGRLFHDLRRSAVRNLIDAGVPQSVAMAITGHRTASMFRRYEIRDASDVREAVAKLAAHDAANIPPTPEVLPIAAAAGSDAFQHGPLSRSRENIGEFDENPGFESRWGRHTTG